MEIPRGQAQPGLGEQTARWAVLLFLLLAMVTLAFGLGYMVKDLSSDDAPAAANGVATGTANTGGSSPDALGAAIIDEIYATLKAQYVDKEVLDPATLRQAAIDGVITSLNDPHTSYISPEDVARGALDLNSSYQGIGASVSDASGQVQIVAPFRDSPAEQAGIRSGDIILEVDGERTDGWTDQEAVQRIRGPKGSTVTLTVKHTDGTTEEITVMRGEIPIQSVFTNPNLETIPGESGEKVVDRDGNEVTDLAYIAISQFHDTTVTELRTALKDIESKGYKGLIVDLRGNPGGRLDATIDVADEFLNGGVILSENDADGNTESWSARPGGEATKIPIVVLQDATSASGSEVLAAAIRDNGRGSIVGTRSFGKGTVNLPIPLRNCGDPKGCGLLYLSVGRWLSPKGEQIEGVGVKPVVEVTMTAEEYVDQGDIQLFKAIDILRGR
jgi:carboxyl-terminal processing protease